MSQKNSFITMLEQIAALNKNSVEIISKLSDVVGTKKEDITINYLDTDGSTSQYQLPTVGYLKKEIDIANSNIEKLSNLDDETSVSITDGVTSKKIKSIELNREPDQISKLDLVSDFGQKKNWFFESLINPLLTVNINLDDKLDSSCSKVLSRRYIIHFEVDSTGAITTAGQTSKSDFETNFLYRNDITLKDFQDWLELPTNTGVIDNDQNQYIDEQTFDLKYKEINYKGYFSVLKYEKDSLNNKLYYHVNTLTYYDRNGNTRILAVDDILATTNKDSYTKWKILEVNTSSSLFRLVLERIEGYDPVAIGTNMLEFYSPLTKDNKINVSIGFDEYNVVFLKPINTDSGIIGSTWSNGMSFYSNDLTLETDSNVGMSDFYINSVYDYGAILKDLVVKSIPSKFGSTPNKPEMNSDNFKVVQINKHLTDTKDYKTLKKLHGQKNSIKAKINQVNDAIIQKNKELNTKQFKSVAERSKSSNELNELVVKQQSDTKLFSSYVSQITNSVAEPTSIPKFRIRGFWDIPDAVVKQGFKPQQVIGFEVQWRYGSKFGTQNITEGFELKKANILTGSDSNQPQYIKKTGYYSEWNKINTDIRKRVYDDSSGEWNWEIEDISDADTPNINQLDISIQKNEKVEIRVRSISEVGYPDSPFKSNWTEIMTIEFPDSLNDVLGDSDFILKEATQEEVKVQFENELSAKGISKHVSNSYYVNEEYVAHIDKVIATSFKDSFGNTLSLYDYLTQMTNKIKSLEEAIQRAKGELKVTLFRGTQETEVRNGASLESIIECEDYMISLNSGSTSDSITFENNVYLISDFYLKFENIAQANPLGLLTSELINNVLSDNTHYPRPSMINADGDIIIQKDNQFVWLNDKANIDGSVKTLYTSITTVVNSGSSSVLAVDENFSNDNTAFRNILNDGIWCDNGTEIDDTEPTLGASVHPRINGGSFYDVSIPEQITDTNNLVDKNNQDIHLVEAQENFIIPINIYFKPNCLLGDSEFTQSRDEEPITIHKTISFMTQPENMARKFEFTLGFNLKRHKKYISPTGGLGFTEPTFDQ